MGCREWRQVSEGAFKDYSAALLYSAADQCCVTCRAYLEQKELRVPWDFGMEGVSQPQDAKMTEGSMRLRLHKASSSF